MDVEATGGDQGANLKCSVFITRVGSLCRWAGWPGCCSELAVGPVITHSGRGHASSSRSSAASRDDSGSDPPLDFTDKDF